MDNYREQGGIGERYTPYSHDKAKGISKGKAPGDRAAASAKPPVPTFVPSSGLSPLRRICRRR